MRSIQLRIALRAIRRQKGYAFINIAGLTLGLTCAMLMLLFITFELSFDHFNRDADRVFRVREKYTRPGRSFNSSSIKRPYPFGAAFPEVEKEARLFSYSWKEKALVAYQEKSFFEERFFLADPEIFDILSFDFLQGDPATALAGPRNLVISQSAASRLFGRDSAMGKIVSVRNLGRADFTVTAVVKDLPANSHVHCDFMAPFAAGDILFWSGFEQGSDAYTYLRLKKGTSPAALEKKFPAYLAGHLPAAEASSLTFHLQPLTSIHLGSRLNDELEPPGDAATVAMFGALTAIILMIAGVNYVNLATARSITRAREVGLRKVMGARRGSLVGQFVSEAVLFAAIALPAAFLLAQFLLPVFNGLIAAHLSFDFRGNGLLLAGMLAVTLAVGIGSGIYPAFVVSAHAPADILKGQLDRGVKGAGLRKTLVVMQYASSVVLMIGAVIVSGQMRFVRSKSLGFDREQVVTIPINDTETMAGYDAAKTAFLRSPAVIGVSGSFGIPSRIRGRSLIRYEGAAGEVEADFPYCFVDFDFLKTYGIPLAAGRDFSREFPADEKTAYLINETAARAFGWADPLGKKIQFSNRGLKFAEFVPGEVIGVVRDFHFQSLRQKIEPLVLKVRRSDFSGMAVRLAPGTTQTGLDYLASQWKQIFPGRPFDFSFLDDEIDRLYRTDRRMGKVYAYATGLGILIAGLGLFGLASLSAARRAREVGIRKVLGASAEGLVVLLSREFGRLVLLANLIAWPLAYALMRRWLDGFAYRTAIGPWPFALAAFVSFALAMAAVSLRAARSVMANPVESLRHE